MKLKERITETLTESTKTCEILAKFLSWLDERDIDLEQGYVSVALWCKTIDINGTSRKDVEKILYHFKLGKWAKEKQGDTLLNYISELPCFDDFKVRLYAAEPPGSCTLIEERVVIPAKPAEPERVVTRMVLKCVPITGEGPTGGTAKSVL